jgi:hypothetical protein
MREVRLLSVFAGTALTGLLATSALAGATPLTTIRVAAGLSNPLYVTHAPGDYSRVYVVEQRSGTVGRIRVLTLPGYGLLATPFLSISPVSTGSEQGLLGLAFHPRYNDENNRRFYVNYTNSSGATVIAEYRALNPLTADPNSVRIVATIAQPFSNHNGGWIGFAPGDTEGYLYVSMGDGGSANDPGNRAQNLSVLLGKMLRIDIDGPDNIPNSGDEDEFPADVNINWAIPPSNPFAGGGGNAAIWAYGLRNPWRASFDALTGDLWIADVGQNAWEEIDFQPGNSAGGENYGWRCMEGFACTGLTGCTCNGPGLKLPIYNYSHAGGNCSVTGGYVYRGCAMPDMHGIYFFADYCTARIWSFRYSIIGGIQEFTERTAELDPPNFTINAITSFGLDAYGEIYITDQGGEVFKIVPNEPITDCNGNGIVDECEVAAGVVPDLNNNGVPDSCECVGDLDGDGDTDQSDLGILLQAFGKHDGGDINGDGVTDQSDLGILLANFPCSQP